MLYPIKSLIIGSWRLIFWRLNYDKLILLYNSKLWMNIWPFIISNVVFSLADLFFCRVFFYIFLVSSSILINTYFSTIILSNLQIEFTVWIVGFQFLLFFTLKSPKHLRFLFNYFISLIIYIIEPS